MRGEAYSVVSLMGKRRGPWATREAQKLFLIEEAQRLEKLINIHKYIQYAWHSEKYFIYINLQ